MPGLLKICTPYQQANAFALFLSPQPSALFAAQGFTRRANRVTMVAAKRPRNENLT